MRDGHCPGCGRSSTLLLAVFLGNRDQLEFAKILDDTDEWFYSDKCVMKMKHDATMEEMEAKCNDVRMQTELMCSEYFTAEKEYEVEKEKEMEEEAKVAAAERISEGNGGR